MTPEVRHDDSENSLDLSTVQAVLFCYVFPPELLTGLWLSVRIVARLYSCKTKRIIGGLLAFFVKMFSTTDFLTS
jgi:hypothetical protein